MRASFLRLRDRYPFLLGNILSLSVLQGVTYILPLISLPYLVRVLGADLYGLIAFSTALIVYFQLVVDYGFNLSATRDVSVARNESRIVAEIFSAVLQIKMLLLLCASLVLALLLMFVESLAQYWTLHVLSFLGVVGAALMPVWLFQGMEEMRYLTLTVVVSRVLSLTLILLTVNQPEDYLLVQLWGGLGSIAASVVTLVIAFRRYRLRWLWLGPSVLRRYMSDGWHIFLSQLNASLLGNSNVFLLGLFASQAAVGYFAAGERIVRAVVNLSVPVTNAVFPISARLMKEDQAAGFGFLSAMTRWGGSALLLGAVLLILLAPLLVDIVLGPEFIGAIPVLVILAPIPLTIFLNNVFGTQVLLNLGHKKLFLTLIFWSGLLNVALALLLVRDLEQTGMAIASLTAEATLAISMYIFARRLGFSLLLRPGAPSK